MIRGDRERAKSAKQATELRKLIQDHRNLLGSMSEFSEEMVERSVAPLVTELQRLVEELNAFELLKSGVLPTGDITQLGSLLVQWRIARGFTQQRLAEALDIDETQVSRYERSEYHGVKIETILRVIAALGLIVFLKATDLDG